MSVKLKELEKLYTEAAEALANTLKWDKLSTASRAEKTRMLASVRKQLKALGSGAATFFDSALPAEYIAGSEAAAAFAEIGTGVMAHGLQQIDKSAVNFLLDASLDDTNNLLYQVERKATALVNSAHLTAAQNAGINKILAASAVKGESIASASQALSQYMDKSWFSSYEDIQGGVKIKVGTKTMQMSDYAVLNARTRLSQATNKGSQNWSKKHGFNFVIVSSHAGSCETCLPFQDKIYHTGPGAEDHNGTYRPPLSETPNGGPPFHPNCRHRTMPWGMPDLDTAEEFGNKEEQEEAAEQIEKKEPITKSPVDAYKPPGTPPVTLAPQLPAPSPLATTLPTAQAAALASEATGGAATAAAERVISKEALEQVAKVRGASTLPELKEAMKDTSVSFYYTKNTNVATAKVMCEASVKMNKAAPIKNKWLSLDLENAASSDHGSLAWALVGQGGGPYMDMGLSHQMATSTPAMVAKKVKSLQKRGWLAKSEADPIAHLTAHEYGHHLGQQTYLARMVKSGNVTRAVGSKAMEEEFRLFKALKKNVRRAELGDYAATDVHEFFAEAWAQYTCSANPSATAIRVGNLVEQSTINKPLGYYKGFMLEK